MLARMFALGALIVGAMSTALGLLFVGIVLFARDRAELGGLLVCSGMALLPGLFLVVVGRKLRRRAEGPSARADNRPAMRPRPRVVQDSLSQLNLLGWLLLLLSIGLGIGYLLGVVWLRDSEQFADRPWLSILGMLGLPLMMLIFRGGRWALERFGWSIHRRQVTVKE